MSLLETLGKGSPEVRAIWQYLENVVVAIHFVISRLVQITRSPAEPSQPVF
jgi:hypothetical protein